jgi:hypothetical protein
MPLSLSAAHFYSVPHRQAEFLQVEAPLSPAKVAQYDAAVALWQNLRSKLEAALQLAGIDKRDVWKTFWAAQQRFFKLLCVGLKLDTVIAEVGRVLRCARLLVVRLAGVWRGIWQRSCGGTAACCVSG